MIGQRFDDESATVVHVRAAVLTLCKAAVTMIFCDCSSRLDSVPIV
jgi:hypothetical protein